MADINLKDIVKRAANLQNFKTIQFLAEFLIFSKYSESQPIFQEFLVATEMVKFVFKLTEYYHSYRHPTNPKNIYMERSPGVSKKQNEGKQGQKSKHKVQRIQKLLENIKKGSWMKNDFQSQIFQEFPNGKKMQLVSSKQVPKEFSKKRFNYKEMIGELLLILRPLASIIAIRIFGSESYIPYFISLAIDLIVLLLQRKATLLSQEQTVQWSSRHRQILWRCLFKRPFYEIFKDHLILPILNKAMREDRMLYKIIMYVVQIQSSITLTL